MKQTRLLKTTFNTAVRSPCAAACCVFRPAFGCCMHTEAGWNTFWGRFQPFLFILNLFNDFTSEIKIKCKGLHKYNGKIIETYTKKVENGSKKVVWPALRCAHPPKAGQNTQQLLKTASRFRNIQKYLKNFLSMDISIHKSRLNTDQMINVNTESMVNLNTN